MKIQVKRWNESTREILVDDIEVVLVQTYRGHDIMRDKDNWLYVFDGSNWQYFGTVREAQGFIRNTDWQKIKQEPVSDNLEEAAPEKIYLVPFGRPIVEPIPKEGGSDVETIWSESPYGNKEAGNIEYTRTDAFMKMVKEAFCKATCNGHPPRSTCTSLGTCKEYDEFIKAIKL